MKVKSTSTVVVLIVLLGAVALAAMGPWSPRSHSRVVGTFNDLVIPVGWEFVHEHRSGNTACLDECPTVTRVFWVDGNLVEATDAVRSLLVENGFDVTIGTIEDPASAPPRRTMQASKGPVQIQISVIEGAIDTAVDHPTTIESGRSGVVMSMRVDTFRDGVYVP